MRVGFWPWLCPQRILMTHPVNQWAQLRVCGVAATLPVKFLSRLSRLCVRGPRRHEKSDQIACVLGGQCASVPQGRHTVNTEPLPGSLATVTSPPIMRASLPAYALGAGGPPARLLDRRGERLAFFGNEKAQSLGRFASAGVLDIMHMLCRVVTRLTLGQGNAFMPIGLHDHGALQHVEVFRPGMKMLARLRAWR